MGDQTIPYPHSLQEFNKMLSSCKKWAREERMIQLIFDDDHDDDGDDSDDDDGDEGGRATKNNCDA